MKISEDRARKELSASFARAQRYSYEFDEDTFVLYNPETGRSIPTPSTAVVEDRRSRGWDLVGRYVSGKLVEVQR